jgi:hypothetical protein
VLFKDDVSFEVYTASSDRMSVTTARQTLSKSQFTLMRMTSCKQPVSIVSGQKKTTGGVYKTQTLMQQCEIKHRVTVRKVTNS